MKVLFKKEGKSLYCADREKEIFCIDDTFYDKNGNAVPSVESFYSDDDDDDWYRGWMKDEGLEEPLKSESVVEPEWEIDDIFGKFGFKNEAGEFVIEPQYAYAHEFTCALACVNLNRTWYKTEDGKRFYENHWGYIDKNGKTVIGFQYDEAHPFNKFGVALVSCLGGPYFLIDTSGNEIPGTRFEYISRYDYNERFLEFSYNDESLVGVYDTKERKIISEPLFDNIIEHNEDCIKVYVRNGKYGESDFNQYYINSKGEILYPWLYNKGFSEVEIPDANNVSSVSIAEYMELSGKQSGYYEHNGKKYAKKHIYGLYSSKEKFLLPTIYDEIKWLCNNIWGCYKDRVFTIVETEKDD